MHVPSPVDFAGFHQRLCAWGRFIHKDWGRLWLQQVNPYFWVNSLLNLGLTLWFNNEKSKIIRKAQATTYDICFLILGTLNNWMGRISFLPFLDAKSLALVFFSSWFCQAYSSRTGFCVFFSPLNPLGLWTKANSTECYCWIARGMFTICMTFTGWPHWRGLLLSQGPILSGRGWEIIDCPA